MLRLLEQSAGPARRGSSNARRPRRPRPRRPRTTGLARLSGHSPAAIGKYQDVRRFEVSSGQAAAYLAFDPDLERHVVLKRYHGDSGEAEEGRALAKVASPFVARCHGIERIEGELYLVVEYIPGRNLGEVRRDGPMDPARVVRIIADLAQGVAAVHARGLIHRDIKPANVILHDDGRPRLVNFGLAAHLGSPRLRQIAGSPPYMAPEQARGHGDRVDHRVNIFGLGGVLYALLTGRPPYAGARPGLDPQARREGRDHAAPPDRPEGPRPDRGRLPEGAGRGPREPPRHGPGVRPRPGAGLAARPAAPPPARGGRGRRRPPRSGPRPGSGRGGVAPAPGRRRVAEGPRAGGGADRGGDRRDAITRIRGRTRPPSRSAWSRSGRSGSDPPRLKDLVRVRVTLSRPAYGYLIALNTDGKDQLCRPVGRPIPGRAAAGARFPRGPEGLFRPDRRRGRPGVRAGRLRPAAAGV